MLSKSWLNLGLVACGLLLNSLPVTGRKSISERNIEHYARGEHMMEEQYSTVDTTDAANYRFLNAKTQPYLLKYLPDVPFSLPEMYSGSVPIGTTNSTLFFIFQPTTGAPVDEVTIWLNGGPGCSSLAGFFQENGPFTWQPGTFRPVANKYGWTKLTNVLWVEQPVGTGFTQGQSGFTTQEETAAQFVEFFKNWEDLFGIKNFKIYVTGESYAGRYVPYISAAMLDQKNTEYFDLKGAITYDPCIGQFVYVQEEVPAVPFLLKNLVNFNLNSSFVSELEAAHQKCGYADYIKKYLVFPASGIQPDLTVHNITRECDVFDAINDEAFRVNPCFNIYETNQQCPLLWDVLSFPTELFFKPAGSVTYFNRKDVKKALHAPVDVTWKICKGGIYVGGHKGRGGPEGEGDLSADPIQKVLPQVIEATNRVLVGNGDLDMIILTEGTLMSIQNMTWNGKLGFQQKPATPIDIELPDLQYNRVFAQNGAEGYDQPQGIMGIQHYERGLMWVETYLSGHMEPEFQPRSSYRHLQWLLGYIEKI